MKLTVKIQGQPIEVEIKDVHSRPIIAIVEGESYEVYPEESPVAVQPVRVQSVPVPARVNVTAAKSNGKSNGNAVHAPIPGVVVSVAVNAGDTVSIGQEICIIEAMKMKNPIRSPRSGTIAALHVNPGQTVNHNDTLVEFDV